MQRSFSNVAVQCFVCCSAASGQNDVGTADKRMLQCNFCSAAFRKLQRNFRFACGMLQGWGLEGWGLGLADPMVRYPPPLRYLVSHRHICAIPHFATYRAIIVKYPLKQTQKSFAITIATSIARYEKYRCWASNRLSLRSGQSTVGGPKP